MFEAFNPDGKIGSTDSLVRALDKYADMIEPWAKAVANYMLADVNRRNEKAWREHGKDIGISLRDVIRTTPVGIEYRELLARQVGLIKSLPRNAGIRAHDLVQRGMIESTRSTDIAKLIMQTSNITEARARLIARTEVSRSAVTLTQVRAQALGSEGYVWRTVRDSDVRPEHRDMEGVYVRWDKPPSFAAEPTLGPYHAGCGPNCRCWPEPVLPEY